MMSKKSHVYIKSVLFQRDIQTGQMSVVVECNHGHFALDDILDSNIINACYDYIREQAAGAIQRHVADQLQEELTKTPAERAAEALGLSQNDDLIDLDEDE